MRSISSHSIMSISGLFAREEKPEIGDSDIGVSDDAVSRDVVDIVDMVEYVDTEYSEAFEDEVREDARDDVCEDVRDEALEGWADGNGDGEECGSDGMASSSYSWACFGS